MGHVTLDGHLVGLLEAYHHVGLLPFHGVQQKDCALVEGDVVLKGLGGLHPPSVVLVSIERRPGIQIVDLLDDVVPLVTGVIRKQLAEQVITSLNSNRMNSSHFYELHLGVGKFNFHNHLVLREFPLRSLGELLQIFEELLANPGSDVKRRAELLLAQDAKVASQTPIWNALNFIVRFNTF
jgi:hypothetical protein